MIKRPLLSVILALLLLAGLYFGVNTIPPKPEPLSQEASGAMVQKPAVFHVDSFELAVKKNLPQHALGEIQSLEKQLFAVKDSSELAPLYQQYGQIWEDHKQVLLAAYYYSLSAKLENSEKKLTFAAQLFLDLARKEHSEELQRWEANTAADCFEQSLTLNKNNEEAKIGLAECYFGSGEAMKGVVLLKEITEKEPDHVAANLLLGQQGLISGQFAKAQQRFETVLKREPKNLEAMLGLAEAFKGLGDKDAAIKLLENCKKQVDNPAFAKDVDEYIKTFK